MVRLVSGGVAEFDAFAYQDRHPSTIQFLTNQWHTASAIVTDAGRKFLEVGQRAFDNALGDTALRKARALKQSVLNVFQQSGVRNLWDIVEIQQANDTMQRFIMADETVRQAYQEQRINGYSDTYVDVHPGAIGEGHYDWRLTMNGIVRDVPAETPDGEEGWKVTWYFDDVVEGDRPLDISEQMSVIYTWAAVKAHLDAGESDPTDPMNGSL